MIISWRILIVIFSMLAVLNLIVLVMTVFVKFRSRKKYGRSEKYRGYLQNLVDGDDHNLEELSRGERTEFLMALHKWNKSYELPEEAEAALDVRLEKWNMGASAEKMLRSPLLHRRTEALLLVELLSPDRQLSMLENAFLKEKNQILQLKMIEILCSINLKHSISLIIDVLKNEPESMKRKIFGFMRPFGLQLSQWAGENRDSTDPLIRRLVILAAHSGRDSWFYPHLLGEIESDNIRIRGDACEVLFSRYISRLDFSRLFESPYDDVRKLAVEYAVIREDGVDLDFSRSLLDRPELRVFAIEALRGLIRTSPDLMTRAFNLFRKTDDMAMKTAWADILSSRITFFAFRIRSEDFTDVGELISFVVALGHYSQIINFLNENRNLELEEALKEVLMPHIQGNGYFRKQCRLYLKRGVQERWEIPDYDQDISEPKFHLTGRDKVYMALMMFAVLLLPVMTFVLTHGSLLPYYTAGETFIAFIFHYQIVFGFYTLAVNSIYLVLMFLSWSVINRQQILWDLADRKFLFTPGLLPSVSILAPAFNEERTIIQNVYSLLSLDYSDFEVIVIDDGSSDGTTASLISHFHMELADYHRLGSIATAPVQGVYKSREYPGLVLISKMNGGKADALNAGINHAVGEYICSIDADSLLEPDALQKIMYRTLVHREETAAVGGNVLPSNGTIVSHGIIRSIHLPEDRAARYQTAEYLRSFISNRLGWSRLNSLLIISGAFGIFKRDRILEMGGYLTGKGRQRKDTVGEDMEVVVHLHEHMRTEGVKYRVDYAYNANCWTEVPEDISSLIKQRDRWHRGLVEVFMYHKKMLFNPRFRGVGLLAFPYFLLFELLGPFLEVLGYFMLIIPIFLGLLDSHIILFVFSISVVFGILISTTSLFLAEKGVLYFKGKDFRSIVVTSVLENFGWRQFMSMLRPLSYILYIFRRRDKGWEKFQRIGFREMEKGDISEKKA